MRPASVLVVDDSALVRRMLCEALEREPGITVVGSAPDPFVARDLLLKLEPDVITLDIEMPRMDGLTFLRKLMAHRPTPVIIVSSITERGSAASIEALRLGAVDVLAKPSGPGSIGHIAGEIARRVRALGAGAKVRAVNHAAAPPRQATPAVRPDQAVRGGLILLGASTGGTQAIEALLTRMPPNGPPILVVQHMPPLFTKAFAQRLDQICQVRVVEAAGGETVMPGVAYVAPGDHHLVVKRMGVNMQLALNDGDPVHYQRPAVDVLFQSAARLTGVPMAAAVLTGMGSDGAAGLLALRNAGAMTFAEDERSCVVFGMPKAAIEAGAACEVHTLLELPGRLLTALSRGRSVSTGTRG